MRILGFLVLGLFWWVSEVEAACSGSGQVWSCTAGSSVANIQSAYNSGADGMTITLSPGSYSFGSSKLSFSNAKGLTLACASVQGCTINHTSQVIDLSNISGTNSKLYRISGFIFDKGNTGGGQAIIWIYAYNGTGAPRIATNIRIDHNRFQNIPTDTRILFFGDGDTPAWFYGVVDHNTVVNSVSVSLAELIGGGDSSLAPAGTRGTASNMYFEDNTITITTMTNAGLGCADSWGGASVVWRYNTTTNCLLASHGVTHSWGPVNWEVYGNRFNVNSGAASGFGDCYRCFHHQGSAEFLAFDNVFSAVGGKSTAALAMTHYRSAVSGSGSARCNGTVAVDGNRSGQLGYPCNRQPGRDVNGTLQPMYAWLNRWSDTGSIITMAVENPWGATNPSVANHVAANRDYYNAVSASAQTSQSSPFNGSTGMGFGTLANRPTTCTPTPQAADAGNGGVGYFATDQGADGTLYRCSSTNTWTAHYTPYTYPHPLQSGQGGGPQPPSAPSAPTNLKVTQS